MLLTMHARLVETPVYAETVFLSLHASSALAAVQRAGQQGRDSVCTLTAGSRAEFHAAVTGDALAQGPETRAAGLITGTGVSRYETVSPRRKHYLQS